ncbi:hypothetical protein TNIN_116311 [Trichonephila inaurata madagascariensis]|uniref:Uncharacterized protein n=1 Tax=Trichonephila inaurata madagascariensis TaxID=2747483 RepID=A0A8X6WUA9_9ARAC|nr:hypothetical protein TNIN_116311 [Trichonephila inaurata madagascariensis]
MDLRGLWLNQPMNEMSSYKIPETFSFPDNALKEKKSVVGMCCQNCAFTRIYWTEYRLYKIEASCLLTLQDLLTELSPDPSDFNALTPAHFLVGGPIHQFSEPSQPSRSVALSEKMKSDSKDYVSTWDQAVHGVFT